MGIYFDSTTDQEDIDYIAKLIDSGKAYYKNNKIYYDVEEETKILWENCEPDAKKNYLGEPKPLLTPWGIGRLTSEGCTYIYSQLMKENRY